MISARTAILVPLAAFYLAYTLQIHLLIPSLSDPQAVKSAALKAFFFIFKPPLEITGPVKIRFGKPKKFERKIVAVGDLHGDLGNARKVLQFAGVTDEDGNWKGDIDFFVQTGDIIDRCAACYLFIAEHALNS